MINKKNYILGILTNHYSNKYFDVRTDIEQSEDVLFATVKGKLSVEISKEIIILNDVYNNLKYGKFKR